jgi:hypothetical protein
MGLTPTQRAAIAYAAVRSEMGARAASDGWVTLLWDYVYEHAREPDVAEQHALRARADEMWREVPTWPWACAREAVTKRFERLRGIANEQR